MQSIAIEYLRFGDDTGIARLSERYLCTVQSGELATVQLNLTQDRLQEAMRRLDYVNYRRGNPEAVREDAEGVLSQLFPRLQAFLPRLPDNLGGEHRQIEIVTQALELAQLPFELLEERDPELIITRRIRLPWPLPPVVRDATPRVLFAWAEPRGMKVPHERHRELLDGFLADWPGALVELEQVSLERLRDCIRSKKQGFTHIYVLAHGVDQGNAPERFNLDSEPPPKVFLGLQNGNEIERCNSKDLAELFETQTPRPAAFILATCDSGEVNPVQSGGSLAHALHRAGVPVVIASQFELTKEGSDRLVDVFLKHIVAGEDPRLALRMCRDALRESADTTYYDRVAIVGYVQLEADIEARLTERKLTFYLEQLKAISNTAGKEISEAQKGDTSDEAVARWLNLLERFNEVRKGLQFIEAKFENDKALRKSFEEETLGLMASSLKREAEAAWRLGRVVGDEKQQSAAVARSRTCLADAAQIYERAARSSRDRHWVWVQWLALKTVLFGALEDHDTDWIVAQAVANDSGDLWGLGSRVELQLLGVWLNDDVARVQAEDDLRQMVERCVGGDPFPIKSTLDQLARYGDWWGVDDSYKLPSEVYDRAVHCYRFLNREWHERSPGP